MSPRAATSCLLLGLACLATATPAPAQDAALPAATVAPGPEAGKRAFASAWEALRASDVATARTRFEEATRLDPSSRDYWQMLAAVEMQLRHHQAAALAVDRLLERFPEMQDNTERVVYALVAEAPASPELDALLQRLLGLEDWKPSSPRAGSVWLRLAHLRLQEGDRDGARAPLARLRHPDDIVRVRSDKRFDGLYDPDSPAFDAGAAAHRRVDDLRVQVILDASRVAAIADTVQAMIGAGMYEAAVDLARRSEAAVRRDPAQPAFEDPQNLPWLMNLHSTALIRLDRVDEGLAKLVEAASGGDIGRRLNLGYAYCELGRAHEARATVAGVDDARATPVGVMVKQAVLHCAALLGGDREAAQRAMDYLAAHRDDSPDAHLWELLRAGRMDEAAASFVLRLQGDATRADALLLAQEFPESRRLPGEAAGYAKLTLLLARPEVQEAISRVGRVQRHEYNSY